MEPRRVRGPPRVPLLLPLVLVGLVAGPGCLDDTDLGDGRRDGGDGRPLPAFGFDCAGASVDRVAGVCVRRLEAPATHLSEPALAWHPDDAAILVVGAHAVGASGVPAASAIPPAVYVTEDGGASWQERRVPMPVTYSGWYYGDPAVAFTPDGRLHYATMAMDPAEVATSAFMPRAGPLLLATVSDDLGATWSSPTVLAGTMDREWLSVGPDGTIYLTWQDYPERSFAAWSTDSGATWSDPLSGPDDCVTGSPVAFLGGLPHMACSVIDVEAQRSSQRLLRLDEDAGQLVAVAEIPVAGNGPRLLPLADGGLAVTTYSGGIAVSPDGGQSWTASGWLPDLVTVDDAWTDQPYVYWSEARDGVLHLLLSKYHRTPTPLNSNGDHEPEESHTVAHVVLSDRDLSIVQETLLTPDERESSAAPPASATPLLGDDWYAMAWHGEDLALVWAWAGGLDLAIVQRTSS